jgi:hypothetical protein
MNNFEPLFRELLVKPFTGKPALAWGEANFARKMPSSKSCDGLFEEADSPRL